MPGFYDNLSDLSYQSGYAGGQARAAAESRAFDRAQMDNDLRFRRQLAIKQFDAALADRDKQQQSNDIVEFLQQLTVPQNLDEGLGINPTTDPNGYIRRVVGMNLVALRKRPSFAPYVWKQVLAPALLQAATGHVPDSVRMQQQNDKQESGNDIAAMKLELDGAEKNLAYAEKQHAAAVKDVNENYKNAGPTGPDHERYWNAFQTAQATAENHRKAVADLTAKRDAARANLDNFYRQKGTGAAAATPRPAPASQPAGGATSQPSATDGIPFAPTDPSLRLKGARYKNARGDVAEWTGTAWRVGL